MGLISFTILGFIAGLIARAILPGNRNNSLLLTLVLGVVGAWVGGILGAILFNGGIKGFFNLGSWILAIVGSVLVLWIYNVIRKRR